jgi:hypothetical protein
MTEDFNEWISSPCAKELISWLETEKVACMSDTFKTDDTKAFLESRGRVLCIGSIINKIKEMRDE